MNNLDRGGNGGRPFFARWQRYALGILASVLAALIATPLHGYLDLPNLSMLFLLAVLLVAVTLGSAPGVLAAILSVGLFDFFFVPPRFSFVVNDGQYLVTFVVMLAVALITGQLTAGLRRQAEVSATEAMRTRALYEMARDLSGALMLEQVVDITRNFLRNVLKADAVILLADGSGALLPRAGEHDLAFGIEPRLASIAFESGTPVENSQLADSGFAVLYLPLKAPMRVRGVVAVRSSEIPPAVLLAQRERLETMASLVAIAVERVHYVDVAQRTQVQMVSERLRSSILSALSHDLRTPLTALVGLADSLTVSRPPLTRDALETAEAIR